MTLRLLSYNIRFGGVNRERPLAAVINACHPDLVILEEATHPYVVETLAGACGMKSYGAMSAHSVAFLSRIDIAKYAWHRVRFARHRYLELVLAQSNTRVFGVHLAAIHSNLTELRRTHEARAILADLAPQRSSFHVLTGDFNTLAPNEPLDVSKLPLRLQAMIWMTGRRLRWTVIGRILAAGYVDSYRHLHQDHGYTFPTWDPHVRLDYAFVPQDNVQRVKKCDVMWNLPTSRDASDHFPLLTEIELP